MKFLLIALTICFSVHLSVAQPPSELLQTLNLTPEQKIEMKALILDYEKEDRSKRAQLRSKMIRILNRQQQIQLLRWRRLHRKQFTHHW